MSPKKPSWHAEAAEQDAGGSDSLSLLTLAHGAADIDLIQLVDKLLVDGML